MPPSKISVLVVEDEALVRFGIVDYLVEQNFEVFEAANADQAIILLNEHADIRVLFTDVDMPGSMDGVRLAAVARRRWPPLRIVVTSGHRTVRLDELPERARFLPKPYNPAELDSLLRTDTKGSPESR
jgi:CheY-like chemotaxis protein